MNHAGARTHEPGATGKAALVWRADPAAPAVAAPENVRLRPIIDALMSAGVDVAPVPYREEYADDVRRQLLALDGVLVWVDPITGTRDRSMLDPLLKEVADAGVWVSAHPDVIQKMGTKEVLYRTRGVGWGSGVHLYRNLDQFRSLFPAVIRTSGARVLKQHRGNGGIGVWKVELAAGATADAGDIVQIQHARHRTDQREELTLSALFERFAPYFEGDGRLIDQPFEPRIADGMVRCYMVGHCVAGFARQFADPATPPDRVLGVPAAKTMFGPAEPSLRALRERMEREWVPAMERELGVAASELPALWDADFLYGPRDAAGNDTYVLCEINVSCVLPYPPEVPAMLAAHVLARLTG